MDKPNDLSILVKFIEYAARNHPHSIDREPILWALAWTIDQWSTIGGIKIPESQEGIRVIEEQAQRFMFEAVRQGAPDLGLPRVVAVLPRRTCSMGAVRFGFIDVLTWEA